MEYFDYYFTNRSEEASSVSSCWMTETDITW